MKIYISNYRNHWISPYTIMERIFFWCDWAKEDGYGPIYPEWVERWADKLDPLSKALQWFLD